MTTMTKTVVALALLALCGSAYGEFPNATDLVLTFVKCSIRSARDGIKDLIPSHNPLHIRPKQFNRTVLGVTYTFDLNNIILANSTDLELRKVNVTTFSAPASALNIDYDIYWKLLNFTSNFTWSAQILGKKIGGQGSVKILLHHTDFTGIFKLKNPGQDGAHVDDFTLKINVKDVEADTEGSGPDFLTKSFVKLAVSQLLNHLPASVGQGIKDRRFNGFWLAKPERVVQMVQWCKDVPEV